MYLKISSHQRLTNKCGVSKGTDDNTFYIGEYIQKTAPNPEEGLSDPRELDFAILSLQLFSL